MAEKAHWDARTQLYLLCQFIEEEGLTESLERFLEERVVLDRAHSADYVFMKPLIFQKSVRIEGTPYHITGIWGPPEGAGSS